MYEEVGSFLVFCNVYNYDVVVKSSRSLSHLLMSFLYKLLASLNIPGPRYSKPKWFLSYLLQNLDDSHKNVEYPE